LPISAQEVSEHACYIQNSLYHITINFVCLKMKRC
jgi:hypothetical protein